MPQPPPERELTVTAVIATRGRPDGCARAVASILAGLGPADRVVAVDQSDGDSTEAALRPLADADRRFTYVRSGRRGISAGHNAGAWEASSDLLLFTDDDCTASPDWAAAWKDFFQQEPAVGMAFGTVASEPFDPREGFTPTFAPPDTGSHGRELFRQGITALGIGANTAVRRDAWTRAHGCDEALGAGTAFGGAEEIDLAYRILRLGYRLGHAPGPSVMHDGFRPNEAASALVQSNALGAGAMWAKHVRCGDPVATLLFLREVGTSTIGIAARVATNRRPLGIRRLKAILAGAISSRRISIDRKTRLYTPEPAKTRSIATV